jgi:O-antigen/teichoic acid export membrane protein
MRFAKGFSITGVSSVLIIILAFVNNILITRYLGPEYRGIYQVASYIILFISLIFGEGIRRNNTIVIGKSAGYLKFLFTNTVKNSLIIVVPLVLFYFLYPLYDNLLPNFSRTLLAITFLTAAFIIFWQAIQGLFLGMEKMYEFNILAVASPAIYLFLNFILIYFLYADLQYILINLTLASSVSSLIGFYYYKKFSALTENLSYNNQTKKGNNIIVRSTISAVAIYILIRSNIFIINYSLSAVQAGIFSIVLIIFEIYQRIPNMAGPVLISKAALNTYTQDVDVTLKLFRLIILFNTAVTIVLVIFGKFIIVLLFKETFADAYIPLLYMAPGLIVFGAGSILNAYYMGKGYPNILMYNNVISSVIFIVISLVFIPAGGIAAAAIICSLIYLIWTVVFLIYFIKQNNLKYKDCILTKREDFSILVEIKNKLRIKFGSGK